MSFSKSSFRCIVPLAAALAVSSCAFKHKKYENPITAQTQQPDKILYDKAIHDMEKGRYEIARITLNTLMNTYESSEYMAKAKLAVLKVEMLSAYRVSNYYLLTPVRGRDLS